MVLGEKLSVGIGWRNLQADGTSQHLAGKQTFSSWRLHWGFQGH